MSAPTDEVDIGRFLAWAARPRETPARNEDLFRIVSRYLAEPDFAASVDRVFSGAGLDLHVDPVEGVIVTARSHSPLRLTVTEFMKRAQPHHRVVLGAAILGIARTAYPDSSMVEDPDRISVFTTQAVVDVLDRVAQTHADSSSEDSDTDEGLVEAWRRWQDLTTGRPNAVRSSTGDRHGLVKRVCKLLVEAGYLNARGEADGGTWSTRARFRHAVMALCEDSDLYRVVNVLDGERIDLDGAGR